MGAPLVSVLINNYNYSRYVGEAIESVLSQTCDDFELIVVDDGSTDSSRDVIDRYDDPRITRIYQENGGQASAFNAGWVRARGRYVAFLDSDDRWKAQKLERCVALLKGVSGVALLQHRLEVIDDTGRFMDQRPMGDWIPPGLYNMKRFVLCMQAPPLITVTSGMMGVRDAMRDCFPLDAGWRISADSVMLARAVGCGTFLYSAEHLADYRIHGANHYAGEEKGVGSPKAEAHLRRLTDVLNQGVCDGALDFEKSPYRVRQRISRRVPGPLGRFLGKSLVRWRRWGALSGARIRATGGAGRED